ncbi:hypothetical protein ACKI1H_29280 [Pseudomonas sp. YH-1]|uniref:hypothetical protein n=1 Tax=Pseudomonas sp. YH-1 TaxID=3384787 RepID=UPI003F7E99D5
MNQKTEMQQIAQKGIDQIHCAMEQIDWLRSTLHIVRERLQGEKDFQHLAKLLGLAIYNTDDWHNLLDCERESLENRLKVAEESLQ